MAEYKINEIQTKAFKRAIHSLSEVLSIQGVFRIDSRHDSPEKLCGDQISFTGPTKFFQGLTHQFLRLSLFVSLCIVEEIYSCIMSCLHTCESIIQGELFGKSNPGSERQNAHFDSCLSQPSVLHLHSITPDFEIYWSLTTQSD